MIRAASTGSAAHYNLAWWQSIELRLRARRSLLVAPNNPALAEKAPAWAWKNSLKSNMYAAIGHEEYQDMLTNDTLGKWDRENFFHHK